MKAPRKLAIIVREKTADRCIGKGCLNAFFQRIDSFEHYKDQELELVAFCHDGGDSDDPIKNIDQRIKRFLKYKVDIVHVSTCNRAINPNYEMIIERLSEHFEVVGYTHGSATRKKKTNGEPFHHIDS